MPAKLSRTVFNQLQKTFSDRVLMKLSTLIKACANNFENYKSFIMKVINQKSEDEFQIYNQAEFVLKPL